MDALKKINLLCVIGPTASGKTEFAAHLAYEVDGEIISADSRQVYRRMNIGTGKDLEEYFVNGVNIPYHLIDIVDPGAEYNVFQYRKDFLSSFEAVRAENKFPVLCGGTGMYLEAVLKGYRLISVPVNEEIRRELGNLTIKEMEDRLRSYRSLHNITDTVSHKRLIRAIEIEEYYQVHSREDISYPEIKPLILGLMIDRETRRKRITDRLVHRLRNGMIDEVQELLDSGISPETLIYYGLEYKYLTLYLMGRSSYNEMFEKLNIAIHQFAKRQMTWFRKMERSGIEIHWIDGILPLDEKIRISKEIIHLYGPGNRIRG